MDAMLGISTGLLKLEKLGSLRVNPFEQDNNQQGQRCGGV
jgi:hypothetical protein